MTPEMTARRREQIREAQARYVRSAKGRAKNRRYRLSEKGRAWWSSYRHGGYAWSG